MKRKILAWVFFILGALLAWVGKMYWDDYQSYQPKALDSYMGLTQGNTREQVRYVMGVPDAVQRPGISERKDIGEVTKEEMNTAARWFYPKQPSGDISVNFENDRVESVMCAGGNACHGVFRIYIDSTEDEVLEIVGKPDMERLDEGYKWMRYNKYNLSLYLEQRRVVMIEYLPAAQK